MMNVRADGYYWVVIKDNPAKVIAEWEVDGWWLIGGNVGIPDEYVTVLSECLVAPP
jgi:hypothetical protein